MSALVSSYDYQLDAAGNRIGVTEVHEVVGAPGTYETITIDWAYDGLNRLVTETMTGESPELTYETTYTFDLLGNRLFKRTDTDLDGEADETTAYVYDNNDRLIVESTTDTTSGDGTTTTYEYGENGNATQQTAKLVTDIEAGAVLSDDEYEYNLQGRLWVARKIDHSSGDTTEQTYTYNTSGIRVAREESVNGAPTTRTIYLIDPMNPTGYAQTLEETIIDIATEEVTRQIAYVLGHDVLAQAVHDFGPSTFDLHTILSDGHGSTRMLMDAAALLLELYHYDAYGNALNFDASAALTVYLYSGEYWDARIALQYLRMRWYDALSGRFTRYDPYAGDMRDPQSLHKYLYTHGNPVMGVDFEGESLISLLGGISISKFVRNSSRAVTVAASYSIAASATSQAILAGVGLTFAGLAVWSHKFAPTVVIFVDSAMRTTVLKDPTRQAIDNQLVSFQNDGTQITAFYVRSHADSDFMRLDDDLYLQMASGSLWLSDINGRFDLAARLDDVLTPDATVILAVCYTGAGANSLAQQASVVLPGRKVLGATRFTAQVPLTSGSFFTARIFEDGYHVGSDIGFHAP